MGGGHRRDLALLFGALGAFFFSLSMLLPTLPLYVRDLGGDPVQVGLVMGIFSVGVLAARPFVGRAVDRRGRRPLLLLGSLVVVAMAPLYAASTAMAAGVIAALVVIRLIHGAGLSAFTSASTTLVADLSPPHRRTEYLGYLSAASIVAFAFGPPVGIEIAERAGWTTLFLAAGAAAAVSALCSTRIGEAPRTAGSEGAPDYRRAILRRAVVVPTLTLLLVTVAHGGANTFLPILLEERLAFNLGFFFLAYSAASLVVRLFAGRISRRAGDGPMVWGGLALYAAGLASLPLVTDVWTMLFAASLFGLGFGTYQPAVYGIVANAASDRSRGMVFSFFLGAFDLGIGLGGMAAGPIVARSGIPTLLYGLAFVPVAAAALFVGTMGWRPEPGAPAIPAGVGEVGAA